MTEPRKNTDIAWITAAAAVLRAVGLLLGSLTASEAVAVRACGYGWEELFRYFRGGASGLFTSSFTYQLILKAVAAVSGWDLWLRLLSFVPGVAVVPVAYAIGMRLGGDRRVARVTAVITALGTQGLFFSATLDYASLLFFLVALATKLWLDILLDEPTEKRVLQLGAVMAVAVCLHPAALLIAIPMNVTFFIWHARSRAVWSWVAVFGVLALLAAVWLPEWHRILPRDQKSFTLLGMMNTEYMPGSGLFLFKFVELYAQVFYALCYFRGPFTHSNFLVFPAALMVPVAFHMVVLYGLRPRAERERERLVFFLTLATLYPAACLLMVVGMDATRLLIPLYIPYYALAATAWVRADSKRARWFLAATFVITAAHFSISFCTTEAKRINWKRVAAYMDRNASHAEPVIFLDGRDDGGLLIYARRAGGYTTGLFPHFDYREMGGHYLQNDIVRVFNGRFDPEPPDVLRAALAGKRRAWVVAVPRTADEPDRMRVNREFLNDEAVALKTVLFPESATFTEGIPPPGSMTATLYAGKK